MSSRRARIGFPVPGGRPFLPFWRFRHPVRAPGTGSPQRTPNSHWQRFHVLCCVCRHARGQTQRCADAVNQWRYRPTPNPSALVPPPEHLPAARNAISPGSPEASRIECFPRLTRPSLRYTATRVPRFSRFKRLPLLRSPIPFRFRSGRCGFGNTPMIQSGSHRTTAVLQT